MMTTVRPKLEAMTNDELHAEQRRLAIILGDDESYLQDVAGRRWCFKRLDQIDELLLQRNAPLTADERAELKELLDEGMPFDDEDGF